MCVYSPIVLEIGLTVSASDSVHIENTRLADDVMSGDGGLSSSSCGDVTATEDAVSAVGVSSNGCDSYSPVSQVIKCFNRPISISSASIRLDIGSTSTPNLTCQDYRCAG